MSTLGHRLTQLDAYVHPRPPPVIQVWHRAADDPGQLVCDETGERLPAGEFRRRYPGAFTMRFDPPSGDLGPEEEEEAEGDGAARP